MVNATGCLFWCWLLWGAVVLVRFVTALKFRCCDRERTTGQSHTFPHRLKFGHWESRAAHFFVFPATTASSFIIAARCGGVKIEWSKVTAAVLTLAVSWGWILSHYAKISTAVKDKTVTWVWNYYMNDDPTADDESGYWSDMICDQLNSNAINRGVIARILSWKWSSTVADVSPVVLRTEGVRRFHAAEYGAANAEFVQPEDVCVGRHATHVDIIATRKPGTFCPGRKMVCGLMQTDWMDVLFTYQAITYYHTQVVADTKQPQITPLTVKISQLQGPLTAGHYCFFFEGVRVPFIKIQETMLRLLVGTCVGICLSFQLTLLFGEELTKTCFIALAVCFGLIGTSAAASFVYVAATSPFSRWIENLICCAVKMALCASAYAFMGYAVNYRAPSTFASVFLSLTAILCVLLAIYSCLVIISLVGAMFCPPSEETRFLERLANCVASIADHNEGWVANLPAYAKRETRSVKAVCQYLIPAQSVKATEYKLLVSLHNTAEPAYLEFSVTDIRKALATKTLVCPAACLFGPSASFLGYKSKNILPTDDLIKEVHCFISEEHMTKPFANQLAPQIVNTLKMQRKTGQNTVFSLTIVPPSPSGFVVDDSAAIRSNSQQQHQPGALRSRSSQSTYTSEKSRKSGYEWSSSGSSRDTQRGPNSVELTPRW